MVQHANTKAHIIGSAIQILKTRGTEGLTMRQVAVHAGMSLGNLQYHFRDKTALFSGLAEHYFTECSALLDDYKADTRQRTTEAKLRSLIRFFLDHLDHLTDMCRIFRELWALSTRDERIHAQLVEYYRLSVDKLAALVGSISGDERASRRIAAILIPYFEGYSITHEALAQTKEETAKVLTGMCSSLLRK